MSLLFHSSVAIESADERDDWTNIELFMRVSCDGVVTGVCIWVRV